MKYKVDSTAYISPKAEIGEECEIGPMCYIGDHVQLGPGCKLQSHVVVDGHTSIGEECEIFPFACLGKAPQDLKYSGDVSYLKIGKKNVIRENVTIHVATGKGNSTIVGDECFIQANCHIAHECIVGNRVIMNMGAGLAGHVEIGDFVNVGGMSGVVQFIRVGTLAMVGGIAKQTQDLPPFCISDGLPAKTLTVNRIGMQRNGKSPEAIKTVFRIFPILMSSELTVEQVIQKIQQDFPGSPEAKVILDFIGQCKKGWAKTK